MRVESGMSHNQSNGIGEFDVNKAIAAIAFLVRETGATMYSVMKMLYLADKAHLEQYGRFITGDHYVAMEQGPVPSCTYNMVKHVRGEDCRRPGDEVAKKFLSCDTESHKITIRQMPDMDELSQSDIECLAEIAGIYRRVGHWAVRDMAHDGAWKKTWSSLRRRLFKSVAMPLSVIAADVDQSGELNAHLRDRHPGEASRA